MEKKRTNRNVKTRGNGEGTIYFSETLNKYVAQYVEPSTGKRKTLTQRKSEGKKEFKDRFNKIMNDINQGVYIEKSQETIVTIATNYIENKRLDGITSPRSYKRDLETLEQIKKTCKDFCNIPIQKVTIKNIEKAKKEIKEYSNSVINKIWGQLQKVFSIASSPSRQIIPFNIMLDENLKKPISDKKTKKVLPLQPKEYDKLISVLNNEEKGHKYCNIIKMQVYSGMRIGEVLARSKGDFNKNDMTFNVHNTLTQDEKYNTILGEHTKTYNKKTQIDEGQRYLPLNNDIFNELLKVVEEEVNKKVTNFNNLFFWDYENNNFIKPTHINSWLTRINKKYNICIGKLSTHRLRHTAITSWAEQGIPKSIIQYLAGHIEDSSITDNYIDISFDFVQKTLKNAN